MTLASGARTQIDNQRTGSGDIVKARFHSATASAEGNSADPADLLEDHLSSLPLICDVVPIRLGMATATGMAAGRSAPVGAGQGSLP